VTGKLLFVAAMSVAVPVTASAAPSGTLPESARACVSFQTWLIKTLPGGSPDSLLAAREAQVASMVLCVKLQGPAPLAVRTVVSTACRGELKTTNFAVRYGGGEYTTFRQCVQHKTGVATVALARAQARGAKQCLARLRTGAPLWQWQSSRFGFGVYVVPGRC
jgi:hypothetical protein